MKFEDVIQALIERKKVRRKGWANKVSYLRIVTEDKQLYLCTLLRKGFVRGDPFTFSLEDLEAEDWEIV